MPTQCVCKAVCLLHDLWVWHPPVGVWIGVLGFLGVIVALTRDPTKITRREKATWVFVMFALLWLEIKSVYQDRNEHDVQQAEVRMREENSFEAIASGIRGSIAESDRNFTETMNRSDTQIGLHHQSLMNLAGAVKTLTGGESYAYMDYVPQQQGLLAFPHKGKYPLYGVSVRVVDLEKIKTNQIEVVITVGDMIQGHANMQAVPESLAGTSAGDHFNANIFFTARNGDWTEILREKRVGDKWIRAIQVRGRFTSFKKEKVVCETIDAGFPRNANGEIDGFSYGGPIPPHCE